MKKYFLILFVGLIPLVISALIIVDIIQEKNDKRVRMEWYKEEMKKK
jgi:hypothetical protein